MFLTRKRSVKRTSRVHLWKSAKSFKSAKRLLSTLLGRVAVQLHFEKTKEKAILIESDTMVDGQKGVCVRDKGLSLGQKSMVHSVPCSELFAHCIC